VYQHIGVETPGQVVPSLQLADEFVGIGFFVAKAHGGEFVDVCLLFVRQIPVTLFVVRRLHVQLVAVRCLGDGPLAFGERFKIRGVYERRTEERGSRESGQRPVRWQHVVGRLSGCAAQFVIVRSHPALQLQPVLNQQAVGPERFCHHFFDGVVFARVWRSRCF